MSTDRLPVALAAADGIDAAARPGRLPWARWTLVLIGLGAVAGAGWVGYQQQLTAGPEETGASAVASRPDRVSMAEVTTPPVRTRPAPREGAVRRSLPPANAGSAPELRWPLWAFQLNQPIPPRDPPLTPPAWRLVGATLSSEGWKVVVLRQGNATPEYFGVGAVLPGGYKIKAITDEDVTFDINKREVILSYTGSR